MFSSSLLRSNQNYWYSTQKRRPTSSRRRRSPNRASPSHSETHEGRPSLPSLSLPIFSKDMIKHSSQCPPSRECLPLSPPYGRDSLEVVGVESAGPRMDRVIPRHDQLVIRSALVAEFILAFGACIPRLVAFRPGRVRVAEWLGMAETSGTKKKGTEEEDQSSGG